MTREEAIKAIKAWDFLDNDKKKVIETLIPELKESEDERIRKELLEHCKNQAKPYIQTGNKCPQIQSWIAWLEKQGKEDSSIQQTYKQGYIEGQRIERKCWLEKQGNNINCIYDKELSELLHIVICRYINDPYISYSERENVSKKILPYVELLEKQGEQKSIDNLTQQEAMDIAVAKCFNEQKTADKIEPKFQHGQWIVWQNKCYKVNYNGCGYELIDQNGLSTSLEYGTIDENAHLWDITKDAKDGDILYHSDTASNGIFIFKELLKYEFGEKVICYCDYDSEDHFCLGEHHTCCWTNAKILRPATKEQRDTLFTKMKEKGYEWDADKKELRKIE